MRAAPHLIAPLIEKRSNPMTATCARSRARMPRHSARPLEGASICRIRLNAEGASTSTDLSVMATCASCVRSFLIWAT